MSINTAVVLCAGFGSRMKQLTAGTPKPMLLLNGKPLLEYTLIHLARYGIEHVIINVHYLSDQIISYFGDGRKLGVKIIYSYEEDPLGTAGAVKNVESILGVHEHFLVLYGDVITDIDYYKLFHVHIHNDQAVATIVLHRRQNSNSRVEMDETYKITRFLERPSEDAAIKCPYDYWVNSGIYCFKRAIYKYLKTPGFSDFPKHIFPSIVRDNAAYGYPLDSYRCSVDTPERLSRLTEDFNAGLVFKR